MSNQKITNKQQQQLQEVIQNNQLPSDKYLLHLNKKFSKVESNRNAEIIYNTGEPMRLNKGDKVTLFKSFLNIRGQDQQTITLEKDFEHELLFCHYVPYDVVSNTGTGYSSDQIFGMQRMSEYEQVPTEQNFLLDYKKEGFLTTFTASDLDGEYTPPFGSPAIMGVCLDYQESADTPPIDDMPSVQMLEFTTKTVIVKAGNYTVEALANNIQSQLNGSDFNRDEFQNLIFNESQNAGTDFNNLVDGAITKKLNVREETAMGYSDLSYISQSLREDEIKPSPAEPIDVASITNKVFWDLASVNRYKERLKQYVENNNEYTTAQNKGRFGVNVIEYPMTYEDDARKSRKATLYDSCLIPHQITKHYNAGAGVNVGTSLEKMVQLNGNRDAFNLPDGDATCRVDFTRNWREGDPSSDAYSIRETSFSGGNSFMFAPIMTNTTATTQPPNAVTIDTDTVNMITSKLEKDRIIGPNNITFSFGNDSINRFSFSDLHTSKKIPSYQYGLGQNNKPAQAVSTGGNSGQQCTQMNIVADASNYQFNKYPIEATSGIMILSFDNTAKKATEKYKAILARLQSNFATNPLQKRIALQQALNIFEHDYYFQTQEDAKKSWNETLWARLGFSYEQLGKISNRQENYYSFFSQLQVKTGGGLLPEKSKTLGLMTHNEADFIFTASMNMLGASIVPKSQTGVYQTFDSLNYLVEGDIIQNTIPIITTQTQDPRVTIDCSQLPNVYEKIYLITSSKHINAEILPDLVGGNNYFLVESNIIPQNYDDPRGNPCSIVGFISKENSTSDTLFSTEGLEFTIKNSVILNEIIVRVLNPDGTVVEDNVVQDASGFIFLIERQSNQMGGYNQGLESQTLEQLTGK